MVPQGRYKEGEEAKGAPPETEPGERAGQAIQGLGEADKGAGEGKEKRGGEGGEDEEDKGGHKVPCKACLVLGFVVVPCAELGGGSRSPWFFWRVFGGLLDLHPLGGNVGPHGTQKGQEEKP